MNKKIKQQYRSIELKSQKNVFALMNSHVCHLQFMMEKGKHSSPNKIIIISKLLYLKLYKFRLL